MRISNPVDLSSEFAALAAKLVQMQTELQTGQNQFSETVTEKLNTVSESMTQGLISAGQQTETAVSNAKTAIEAAIESTTTAVTATETAVIDVCRNARATILTAINNHSVIRRIYQITTKTGRTITIPSVNPAKTFVNVNVEDSAGYAELTSATTLKLNRIGGTDKYMRIQVIEYV
ncbi:hypothetical protein [Vibrio quintilis]|uniref:Uncharacterized protein n=1 Tax=Vibrio quintilis TaxID=1117707 RepID=A0A1M7Z2M8_9VIBR|nr:hypothetical protein [Vibrio quintilis]SHO59141.1 hypothetical protein VQ7734_04918 [Vibrio quintilis]